MKKLTERSTEKNLRDVRVGENVRIYDFVNLYECVIGDNSHIATFVEIHKGSGHREELQNFFPFFYL
jgi:hypothetical protein